MGWGGGRLLLGGTVEVGTIIDFIALYRFPSSSCQEKKKRKKKVSEWLEK